MAQIKQQLAGVDPDLIYNIDETGLLYRGLSSRSYVRADERRTARGSKVMRSKDRVTLTLCCNATKSHKLPVAMIGKAVQHLCFTGQGNACSLPYFSQRSAWTDGTVFKMWFEEVFGQAIRSRTGSDVFLILDNLRCHAGISNLQVTIVELPPNMTAIYQPLDAGAIAELQRRYKPRLLVRVVGSLDRLAATSGPAPRIPRGGGLDQGGQAHLMDAVKILLDEWQSMSAEQLSNCCIKADVLPTEAMAEVRR